MSREDEDEDEGNNNLVLLEKVELPNSGKHVAVVTLNRPSRLNCFNSELASQLSRVFSKIANQLDVKDSKGIQEDDEDDDEENESNDGDFSNITAVIFHGKGRSFCAGADLTNPPNPVHQASDLLHHLTLNPTYQMSRISVPIIGACHGHVITGGFELALNCDLIIGCENTKFMDTHVKFGLAPCWGLSQLLQRRVGMGRAKLISFTAMPVRGQTAFSWGLLDDFVDMNNDKTTSMEEAVLERALEIADKISENNITMVKRYKKALVEGGKMDLHKGLQRERELGISHYIEVMSKTETFKNAKEYVENKDRPRSLQSKL